MGYGQIVNQDDRRFFGSKVGRRPLPSQMKLLADARSSAAEPMSATMKKALAMTWRGRYPGCSATPYDDAPLLAPPPLPEPEPEAPEVPGFIYFVRGGERLKIGYAADVATRLSGLQVGSPLRLELVHAIRGTRKDERDLHVRFAPLREHGEWFRYESDLAAYVERLSAPVP